MAKRGRPNRSGVDWSDTEARKARARENTRAWRARGAKKQPIVIDGTEYPTQRAAAAALGVSQQAIWNRLHPDRVKRHKVAARRRKTPPPKGLSNRRWIRVPKADVLTAHRLLPLFPQIQSIDELFSLALRRLAETTDD